MLSGARTLVSIHVPLTREERLPGLEGTLVEFMFQSTFPSLERKHASSILESGQHLRFQSTFPSLERNDQYACQFPATIVRFNPRSPHSRGTTSGHCCEPQR